MVNNEDVEALERLLERYKAGEIRGLVLSYQDGGGGVEHQLMGAFADNLVAACQQVRRLDVALNRHFLRDNS